MKKFVLQFFTLAFISLSAYAQIPKTLSYQGLLTNNSGNRVSDGEYDIVFRLYNSESGGISLWEEAQTLMVEKGIFNATLGSSVTLELPFDMPYWLGIKVGSDNEMSPRIALTASAYSLAQPKMTLMDEQDTMLWKVQDNNLYYPMGNVGIGTNSPTNNLQVGDFNTASDQFLSVNTAGGQHYKSGIELKHYSEEAGFTIYSDDSWSSGATGLHIKRHHVTFPKGGIQAFTIDRLTGNVGIGTTWPQQKLDIQDGSIQLTDTGSVNALVNRPFIYLNQVGDSPYGGGLIWQDDSINEMELFYSNDRGELYFYDNEHLWVTAIRDSGSIWTKSYIAPSAIHFRDGTKLSSVNEVSSPWGNDSGNLFYNSGNIGIGTETPEVGIHVLRNDTNAVLRLEAPGPSFESRIEFKKFGSLGDAAVGFFPGNADLRFRTKENTALVFEHGEMEQMRIHPNGNLGLGTKNPQYKLDAKGDIRIGSGTEKASLYFDEIEGAKWNISTENYRLSFLNNNEEPNMVINQDGNVGIGVEEPSEKFVVNGNIRAKNISLEQEERGALFFAGVNNFDLAMYNNQGFLDGEGLTDGIMLNIGQGLNIRSGWTNAKNSALFINEAGNVGINTGQDVQLQLAIGDSDTGFQQEGDGELAVYTNNVERMRVNLFGQVGIGTSNPSSLLEVSSASDGGTYSALTNTSAGGRKWVFISTGENNGEGSGRLLIKDIEAGTVRMNIDTDGNVGMGTYVQSHPLEMASGAHVTAGGVWTNASSRVLKENIKELSTNDAMGALAVLKPVTYNYLSEKDESYVGFIAEDVPEVVATNDRKSLSSMDIVALLTKVVQEQQKSIDVLSKELELLKKAMNQE